MKGVVIKSTGSWYTVKTKNSLVEARLRGKFKLENKKITNPIAVGDIVVLTEHDHKEWIIAEISPRKNYVIRQSPRKKHYDHIIASNIDQGLLIATLKKPRTSLGFIDRFLVTLEAFRIPGIILFNKTDLLDKAELEELDFLKYRYEKLGYQCFFSSLKNGEFTADLKSLFLNKTTLVSGHSGAGKSTMINYLLPEVDQKVSEISHFANKGVHTTTFAEMFFIDDQSSLIDTPGIKELGLSEIESEELAHYFPEMRALLGNCKYHNCSHVNEPKCAIKLAVEEGIISEDRYASYLSMLAGEDNRR
ncbi:MAG: ribosome small subunit-dependent GTPase A [Cyclobacteriaceae bacterium]